VTAVATGPYPFVAWSDGTTAAVRIAAAVTSDATYTALFDIPIYELRYVAGVGGSVSGQAVQLVGEGARGTTVTAFPDAGYRFVSWSDGVITAARTDAVAHGGVTVTARFAALPAAAAISTPIAPSTMRRGRAAVIRGYVSPAHASGTYLVTLKFYLRNSKGVYVYHHAVRAKGSYYSGSKTAYKASVALPHKGRWRVRAYHSCAIHPGSFSGYDYITVR
jgi:hypothetical protein